MALAVCATVAEGGIRYDVTTIGGSGSGLNNDAVVVGQHGTDAFWWTAATGRTTVGPTTWDNAATDVNDSGILVGYTRTTYNYGRYVNYSAFAHNVWTGEAVSTGISLTQLPRAINNVNHTTGLNKTRDVPAGSRFQGVSYHLDQFGGTYNANWGESVDAYDISDRGVAVGEGGKVRTRTGWVNLPTSGTTQAYGVNDRWSGSHDAGVICGVAGNLPAYWDGSGDLTVVNTHDITAGSFRRVNDHGQIVGEVKISGGAEQGAVYHDGELVLLNSVTSTSTTIYKVMDINDRGQILAWDYSVGSVLLDPVYFADGAFTIDSLTGDWQASGPGTADMFEVEPGDYAVRLSAGSPITITQDVSTPDAIFELSDDYEFLSTDPLAELVVMLDGVMIDTLVAPDMLVGDSTTRTIAIDDPASGLIGLDDVLLSLTYDGPTGTQMLIDNIAITQIVPEPTTMMLLALGSLAMLRRRRA